MRSSFRSFAVKCSKCITWWHLQQRVHFKMNLLHAASSVDSLLWKYAAVPLLCAQPQPHQWSDSAEFWRVQTVFRLCLASLPSPLALVTAFYYYCTLQFINTVTMRNFDARSKTFLLNLTFSTPLTFSWHLSGWWVGVVNSGWLGKILTLATPNNLKMEVFLHLELRHYISCILRASLWSITFLVL